MKTHVVQKTFLFLTTYELIAPSFLSQILNTDTIPIIKSYLLIYSFDMLGVFFLIKELVYDIYFLRWNILYSNAYL